MLIYVAIPLRLSSASCSTRISNYDPCFLTRHVFNPWVGIPLLFIFCSQSFCSSACAASFFAASFFPGVSLAGGSSVPLPLPFPLSIIHSRQSDTTWDTYMKKEKDVCAYRDWEASRSPLYLEWNMVSKSKWVLLLFLSQQAESSLGSKSKVVDRWYTRWRDVYIYFPLVFIQSLLSTNPWSRDTVHVIASIYLDRILIF